MEATTVGGPHVHQLSAPPVRNPFDDSEEAEGVVPQGVLDLSTEEAQEHLQDLSLDTSGDTLYLDIDPNEVEELDQYLLGAGSVGGKTPHPRPRGQHQDWRPLRH